MNNVSKNQRHYHREESITFRKTTEPFGGLSNMAKGYPLLVNQIHIRTTEALYQLCRFPRLPNIQKAIIAQSSPMTAKMISRKNIKKSRPDWIMIRLDVMRWVLRVKLAQNWDKFSLLLLSTGDKSIVEESGRKDYWSATSITEQELVGINALGRLLMELREDLKNSPEEKFKLVHPPKIEQFLLMGKPIKDTV